ncbi:hypothetical protein TUM18999_18770 [Pseudomonas tohonis]|uniref:Uncharacterized protein n=1 Tax=Pseudomonas tohonis TaxID=2725477 RepID=A0A6J4E398_9PSED|nr:hypothetical protein TUM18999_18770 [Pseudomonas tohonis]GJN51730.1 hypothetical protein TUM20286_14820 [Pseudomonas tohonis]
MSLTFMQPPRASSASNSIKLRILNPPRPATKNRHSAQRCSFRAITYSAANTGRPHSPPHALERLPARPHEPLPRVAALRQGAQRALRPGHGTVETLARIAPCKS